MSVERPSLLVVRTGRREFREYLLRSLARHYRIHMFLGAEATWEREYITGWTVVTDSLDTAAMVATARSLHDVEPFDGILCWDESRIVQSTAIAVALGLPGVPDEVTARCRDKHLTRLALDAAGVPQPGSVRVDTVTEALAAAERFGYPVILKPSDLALSMGVVKVDDSDQLTAYFDFTRGQLVDELPDYRVRVLVEEYAEGEEISVDVAVHRGEVYPLCFARKQIGFPPYCIETGHLVDGGDPLRDDPVLLDVLRRTHAALGWTDGVTHTELKLTPTGPKVIEVNGRLGGDLIPYLGLRATGVDVGLAAAAVACGRPPVPAADRKLVAGVRFFYPERVNSVIRSVRFDGELPPAVDEAVVLARPGVVKSPPPEGTAAGRVAFVTAVAETAEECRAALDAAAAALVVEIEPA